MAASRALGGGPEALALPPPRNAGSAGNATASVSAMARGLKGPAWQTMPFLMRKHKPEQHVGWCAHTSPISCIRDALFAPLFGSTLAVLMPALLAVAATEVLFTMSRGLLRLGGTTGKGFAWHLGEGSCARHAKPSEQQALSKVLTTQSPPAQSSELPAAAADSASRNTTCKTSPTCWCYYHVLSLSIVLRIPQDCQWQQRLFLATCGSSSHWSSSIMSICRRASPLT